MKPIKNSSVPGAGFIFTENGLSLKDMAAKLHEAGYISDAEMAEDGGVSALKRKLYDGVAQNRHHYSSARPKWSELTESQRQEQRENERLTREVNDYADSIGVNSPEFMSMIVLVSDLREFGLEVTGRNIVSAELIATAIQKDPASFQQNRGAATPLKMRLIEMVEWILDDRPERQAD